MSESRSEHKKCLALVSKTEFRKYHWKVQTLMSEFRMIRCRLCIFACSRNF